MLTLFDSNAWWKVFLFALAAAAVNTAAAPKMSALLRPTGIAFGRGVVDAVLAFLFGLTPFFSYYLGYSARFYSALGFDGSHT